MGLNVSCSPGIKEAVEGGGVGVTNIYKKKILIFEPPVEA